MTIEEKVDAIVMFLGIEGQTAETILLARIARQEKEAAELQAFLDGTERSLRLAGEYPIRK